MNLPSVAYDYDAQEWTEEPTRVRALLERQWTEERELIAGPRGEEYLAMVGGPAKDVALASLDARLALLAPQHAILT